MNNQNLNRGGTKGNKGGGRNPDWLKAKCREIIVKKDLIGFLGNVAAGAEIEQSVGSEGEVIKIPCNVKDRIKATELLFDRGYGKSVQSFESSSLKDFVIELVKFGSEKN